MFVGERSGRNVAVDFVGRDVDETLEVELARDLEQSESAGDVGFDDRRGLIDAAIDVRLGCEMNDGIAAVHGRFDASGVANVAFDETILRMVCDRIEVPKIPGVGQLVVVDDRVVPDRAPERAE